LFANNTEGIQLTFFERARKKRNTCTCYINQWYLY